MSGEVLTTEPITKSITKPTINQTDHLIDHQPKKILI